MTVTMLMKRTDRGLKVQTPAKLNLFLEVLARCADGYHEIDTVMCPVSLLSQLHLEPGLGDQIDFSIRSPSAPLADPAWNILSTTPTWS